MATGRWTEEEHARFLEGIRLHGTNWREIQKLVPLRSVLQLRTHAQKDFLRVAKEVSGLESVECVCWGRRK